MNDAVTATEKPNSFDYRRLAEWVGLGGPRPDNATLALYLEIKLENREEVDAVEAAVIRESVKVLREAEELQAENARRREALGKCRSSIAGYAITKSEQYPFVLKNINNELQRIDGVARAALKGA